MSAHAVVANVPPRDDGSSVEVSNSKKGGLLRPLQKNRESAYQHGWCVINKPGLFEKVNKGSPCLPSLLPKRQQPSPTTSVLQRPGVNPPCRRRLE